MALDFDSELNAECITAFGEEVIFSHGSETETVSGIRLDPATMLELSPGVVAAYWFQLSDLSQAPVGGDQVTAGGKTYRVVGKPAVDSGGGITVGLIEA